MPPKPWQTSGQSTTSASPYGNSNANDGAPKPWDTGTTQTAGDGEAATAGRPWQGTAQLAGDPSTSLNPYNQTSYGGQGTLYGGQVGSPMYGRPTGSPYGTTANNMYGSTYGNTYGSAYGNTYGGSAYGSSPYGTGGMYGSGMYGGGSMYGSSPYGSMYGGSNMYGGGMGGGMYGSGMYNRGVGSGMGMYNSQYGAGYSGYGVANSIGPPGQQLQGPPGAPGNPMQPPRTKWQMTLDSLHGLMTFFGRISMLMDENAHAVHFFITALLQLLDRASFLWGEIARFVLRLLGYKKPLDRQGGTPDMCEVVKGGAGHNAGAPGVPRGAGNDLEGVWKAN